MSYNHCKQIVANFFPVFLSPSRASGDVKKPRETSGKSKKNRFDRRELTAPKGTFSDLPSKRPKCLSATVVNARFSHRRDSVSARDLRGNRLIDGPKNSNGCRKVAKFDRKLDRGSTNYLEADLMSERRK